MGVGQSKTYDVCKIQKEAGGRVSTSIKKEDYSIIQLKNEVKKNIEETEKRKSKVNWQEPTTSKVFEETPDTATVFEKINVKPEDEKKGENDAEIKPGSEGIEKGEEETLKIIIQNESRSDVAAEIKEMIQNNEEAEVSENETVEEMIASVNQPEDTIKSRRDSLNFKETVAIEETKENEIVTPQTRKISDDKKEEVEEMISRHEENEAKVEENETVQENKEVEIKPIGLEINETEIVEEMIAIVNLQKFEESEIQAKKAAEENKCTEEDINEKETVNLQKHRETETIITENQSVKNSTKLEEKEIIEEMIATVNLQNEAQIRKLSNFVEDTNQTSKVGEGVEGIVENIKAKIEEAKELESEINPSSNIEEMVKEEIPKSKDIIENHINPEVTDEKNLKSENEEIKVDIEVHEMKEKKEKIPALETSTHAKKEEIPKKENNSEEKQESISQFLQTIHQIEEEVKNLKDQIIQFNGTTEDIQYKILYESLIDYIIKLDDIIVANNEEIRNERKRVIKFVQEWTQTLQRNVEKKKNDDDNNSDLD